MTFEQLLENSYNLAQSSRDLNTALEKCHRNIKNGNILWRAIYQEQLDCLSIEAVELQKLVLECALYVARGIEKAEKEKRDLNLSIAQKGRLNSFMERAQKPLFPCLNKKTVSLHALQPTFVTADC
ncbi:MAG: hypothetical protein ACLQO6_12700 [Desulfomonilaceae bacterium]